MFLFPVVKIAPDAAEHFIGRHRMKQQLDPLYVIFEQHLFQFSDADEDRKTFIHSVVHDYLGFLKKQNISVPRPLEQPIVDELSSLVHTMLVKKIYGCLSISDYQDTIPKTIKQKAKTRYRRILKKKAS